MKRKNRNIQIAVIGPMAAVNLTALTSIVLSGNTMVPPGLGYASVLAIVAAMLPSMSGNSAEERLLPLRARTPWGKFLLALASAMFLTGVRERVHRAGAADAHHSAAHLGVPHLGIPMGAGAAEEGSRTNGSDGSPDGAKP